MSRYPQPMPTTGERSLAGGQVAARFIARQGSHLILRQLLAGMLCLLVVSVSACQGEEMYPASITDYNHTDTAIGHITVNGNGGAGMMPNSQGGLACCVDVPAKWRPGMTMTVGWTDHNDENYQTRVVAVPKYDKGGSVTVHFLRNGEIRVFVTNYGLGHPDYPLKGPEAGMREGEDPVEVIGRRSGWVK